jgi:RNA polymerase nonessential primary-like sigma factor
MNAVGRFKERALPAFCRSLPKQRRGRAARIRECWGLYDATRKLFIERSLYMVPPLTMRYLTYGVPQSDLIQEGNAALIRAVEKFDWRKKVRLQTYAAFWIRQAVERYITANRRPVRIPNYMQQKLRRFRRENPPSKNGRGPASKEVAEALDVPSHIAGRLLEIERNAVSINAVENDDDLVTFENSIAASEEEELRDSDRMELEQSLHKALDVVTDKERHVLKRRFGFDGKREESLDDIGSDMGLSRERIRQIQLRAIERLRHDPDADRLRAFW